MVVLEALSPAGVPGVHRVACLVRQRVDVREDILFVVHQDVRGRLVGAVGEGAAALSLILVPVAPAFLPESPSEHRDVFLAERGEGSENHFSGFVKTDLGLHRGDHGRVGVVDMQVGKVEDSLPKGVIVVEDGQA